MGFCPSLLYPGALSLSLSKQKPLHFPSVPFQRGHPLGQWERLASGSHHLHSELYAKAFLKFMKLLFRPLSYCQILSQDHSTDNRVPGVTQTQRCKVKVLWSVDGVVCSGGHSLPRMLRPFHVPIKTPHRNFRNSPDSPQNSLLSYQRMISINQESAGWGMHRALASQPRT